MRKTQLKKRVAISGQLLYCGCKDLFLNGMVYPMRMPEGTYAISACPCKNFATIRALLKESDLKDCRLVSNPNGTWKFVINNPALLVRLLKEKITGYLYSFTSSGFEENNPLDYRFYERRTHESYESVGLENLPFKLQEGIFSYPIPLLVN